MITQIIPNIFTTLPQFLKECVIPQIHCAFFSLPHHSYTSSPNLNPCRLTDHCAMDLSLAMIAPGPKIVHKFHLKSQRRGGSKFQMLG